MKNNHVNTPMTKKILSCFLKMFLMILICAFVGVALIYLTRWIPQSAVKDNISGSVITLLNEPQFVWTGIAGSNLDNFTDGLVLNVSFTETGNKFADALLAPYIRYTDSLDPTTPLYTYIYTNDATIMVDEYARYWHGHQIIAKPLLCLFSISSIRFINMICQILVLFGVLSMLMKKNRSQLIPPIIVMWISLVPGALFQSLQYSPMYYITMLGMMAIIANYETKEKEKLLLIFELIGILVAFFDLLTYPFLSLGAALILLFSLEKEKNNTFGKTIAQLSMYSFAWAFGYLGMFSAKWIISSIFTPNNIIKSAINALLIRSSQNVGSSSYTLWDAILLNVSLYRNGIFLVLALVVLLWGIILIIKNKKIDINVPFLIATCVVALYPFVWYMVTINHSVIHKMYTFRELAITWYAFATIFLLQNKKNKQSKK